MSEIPLYKQSRNVATSKTKNPASLFVLRSANTFIINQILAPLDFPSKSHCIIRTQQLQSFVTKNYRKLLSGLLEYLARKKTPTHLRPSRIPHIGLR